MLSTISHFDLLEASDDIYSMRKREEINNYYLLKIIIIKSYLHDLL
jgi:hypothetical protein